MYSHRSIEHLTFLCRQLAEIADDGDERASLARLKEAAQGRYTSAFADLEKLLQSDADHGFSHHHPFRLLARLTQEVPRRRITLLRGYVEFLRQSRMVYATYWKGAMGVFSYLATLAVILMVVSFIFGFWSMPSFAQLFEEFGAELPRLTATVFSLGGVGLTGLAGLVLAIILLIAVFATSTIRRMKRLDLLPAWPSWVPLFGGVATDYNQIVMLNLARLLIRAEVPQNEAVRIAAQATDQSETLSPELALAARVGNLGNELEVQCNERLETLALGLVGERDRFALVLKLAIYLLVAVLIIAMYLPIFRLGSVI